MLDSDGWYVRQLAHQTRKWRIPGAGQTRATAQFLESAWKYPRQPQFWHADVTWELVRQALRWHQRLTNQLQRWQWPLCQNWWSEHDGPMWDPYDWIIACHHRSPKAWMQDFDDILHHPQVHPGLSAWAWAVWHEQPDVRSFTHMTPLQAIDTALRTCSPPSGGGTWARAWQEWVTEPEPDDTIRLSASLYPTAVIGAWKEALESYEEWTPGEFPPYRTEQLEFFDVSDLP